MRNGGLGFHCPEAETHALPHNAVAVLEHADELLYYTVVVNASPAQGNGSHGPNVGILVVQKLHQGSNNSSVLELAWTGKGRGNL